MKKTASIILALIIALSCVLPAFAAGETDDFLPVLRFIAASDSHLWDENDNLNSRIGRALENTYALAEEDESYQRLDALIVAGDLTNDGRKIQFDNLKNVLDASLHDETAFLGVVAKNHDGYEMKRAEMRAYYSAVTGNEPDFHTVINGYHFIGISASEKDGAHYDLNQISWLKKQLDDAVKDDPNRPVFVIHHEPSMGTTYGSNLLNVGVPYFRPVLNCYPQVVEFCGHSHYPLNDPRSIWQGEYTAVNTGALYYIDFYVEGYTGYMPGGAYGIATYWVVELDAENRMRLRGMQLGTDACLCEYLLDNPANPQNRAFTPEKQKDASRPPVFGTDTKPEAEPGFGTCHITSPLAQSADGMPVVMYRANAKDSAGVTVARSWTLPKYYTAEEQTEIAFDLEGLGKGNYTVYVVAENAYGMQSEPISTVVAVDGENAFVSFFNRIGILLRELINKIKTMF